MDFLKILDYFTGSLVLSVSVYIISKVILNKKTQVTKKEIVYTIIFAIINIINYFVFDNSIRVVTSYIIISFYIKILFSENMKTAMIAGFITLILTTISEIIFTIIVALISALFKNFNASCFLLTTIVNIIIAFLSTMLCYKFKENIRKILIKNKNKVKPYIIITSIIILLTIGITLIKLLNNHWIIDKSFINNVILIVLLVTISIVLLYQELSKNTILDNYYMANEYLRVNAEMIEKYSATQHQHKNHLLTIRGLSKKNKIVCNYIDSLLEETNYKNYRWVTQINRIPFEGLKYLIYQKLANAENKELNVIVNVSKDLTKIKIIISSKEQSYISSIIGEYFDNAIYEASLSKEKEIVFDCYVEENKIKIEIANTLSQKEIDLEKIGQRGISTKGENRGLGLYEVDRMAKNNKYFTTERLIENDYFIAKVQINKQQ